MITLRQLIKEAVIDENQKIWCYKWECGKGYYTTFKGYAHNLKDDSILDNENISIAEIQREDVEWLTKCNYKKDYIGIYYNE